MKGIVGNAGSNLSRKYIYMRARKTKLNATLYVQRWGSVSHPAKLWETKVAYLAYGRLSKVSVVGAARDSRNFCDRIHDGDVTTPAHSWAYNRMAASDFHVSISLSLFVRPAIVIRQIAHIYGSVLRCARLIDVDFRYSLSTRRAPNRELLLPTGGQAGSHQLRIINFHRRYLRARMALIRAADAPFPSRIAATIWSLDPIPITNGGPSEGRDFESYVCYECSRDR